MASIVKKIIRGKPYYYARECRRVNGKPKIVSQKYLGRAADIIAAMTAKNGAAESQPGLESGLDPDPFAAALLAMKADDDPAARSARDANRRKARARVQSVYCPNTVDDYRCAFVDLGIRLPVFDRLSEWMPPLSDETDAQKHWDHVLGLLRHVHFWVTASTASRTIARDFYGKGKNAVEAERARPGDLDNAQEILARTIRATEMAYAECVRVNPSDMVPESLELPTGGPDKTEPPKMRWNFVYHSGAPLALGHLRDALRALRKGNFEIDPTLPKRVAGRKARLSMPWRKGRKGEDAKPRRRRDIERELSQQLGTTRPGERVPHQLVKDLLKPIFALVKK